jgi:hypothetical protein
MGDDVDTFSAVAIILSVVAFLAAMVGLWALSKKCPPGVVLGVAIVLFIAGRILGSSSFLATSRIAHGVAGVVALIGFAGFFLGVIDLRRLVGNKPRNRSNQNALLRQTMGSKAPAPKAKSDVRPANN